MYRNANPACSVGRKPNQISLPESVWLRIVQSVKLWWKLQILKHDVMRERKELAELPDHLLRDIGVCRGDADRESARTADDLPEDRRTSLV